MCVLLLSQVRGVSKGMVVDVGITLQGDSEDELPEQILCQARFDHVDLNAAVPVRMHADIAVSDSATSSAGEPFAVVETGSAPPPKHKHAGKH